MSEFRLQLSNLFWRLILSVGRRLKWLGRSLRALPHDLAILRAAASRDGQVRVYYGYDHIPRAGEIIGGGTVSSRLKLQCLQKDFPNCPGQFNVLYLISSGLPDGEIQKARLSRKIDARVVLNQNGVAYPGWPDAGWRAMNAPNAFLHRNADFVFYQSKFCQLSAERFLGSRPGPSEVLYNTVDTHVFIPAAFDPSPRRLTLLLGGDISQEYRFTSAALCLALLAKKRFDVKLLVAGRMLWRHKRDGGEEAGLRDAHRRLEQLGLESSVEFLGPYPPAEAPSVFRKAHVLLHTKDKDPCPGNVIQAMACGLPVMYSKSGGVPELVGEEAGVGVPAELCWDRDVSPDPEALAEAVLHVAADRKRFAEAARRRAVERFDLNPWIERHRVVFEKLLQ